MELKEFKESLQKSINSNETSVALCRCFIKYSGRAEAELDEGDRVIIIKSDNTLLVHQTEGSNPINYMKADSKIDLIDIDYHDEKALLIQSYNQKYKDYLDVIIKEVYSFQSRKLEDGRKLVLVGTEQDMSDMIKDNPYVISEDFKPLSREEHTRFGFIDVFGHDSKGNLLVVECKRYTAGHDAVQQLRRYVEKIAELKGISLNNIKGIIAAPDMASNAKYMLEKWSFSFVCVNPPKRLEKYNKSQKSLGEF